MQGITISKKLYGDPTFGQPQTKQGWIDNTMEPLHDAKKTFWKAAETVLL